MNIIIKRCIKFILLPIAVILIIYFIFASIDRTKKLDYDTSYNNALNYIENIRQVIQDSEYGACKESYEEDKYDGGFCISSCYWLSDSSYLRFSVSHMQGAEGFDISYNSGVDEYCPGKSGIDLDIVMPILERVCGYDFSEEDISGFIENALEKNIINVNERYGYLIYDSDFINFWENWKMSYSIQEDNSENGLPHPKYYVLFSIYGLTKTGTR